MYGYCFPAANEVVLYNFSISLLQGAYHRAAVAGRTFARRLLGAESLMFRHEALRADKWQNSSLQIACILYKSCPLIFYRRHTPNR